MVPADDDDEGEGPDTGADVNEEDEMETGLAQEGYWGF